MTDSEIYPLRRGYIGKAPDEVTAAVRLVIGDWDRLNWTTVRHCLEVTQPNANLDDWTMSDIRQRFAIAQKPITLQLGGRVNTTDGTITPMAWNIVQVDGFNGTLAPRKGIGKRVRTKKRWTFPEIDAHIEQVLKSQDPEKIKAYVFEPDEELAIRIGCNKKTLYKTRFWQDERELMQAEWRRLNTAGEIPKKRDQ